MDQTGRSYLSSWFSRYFYLVGEENALKHQKSWWLGVAPGSVVSSLIYLIKSGQKWHILVEITFDPSNCLETPNKHSETFLHIPMHHQRPKEHQNWAFRSIFSHLEVTMKAWNAAWKMDFLTFFSIFSNFFYAMHPETCRNKLAHQNTYLVAEGAPHLAN